MDLSRDSGLLQEEQRPEERRPAAEPEVLRSKALVRDVPADEADAPAENETAVAERPAKTGDEAYLSRDLIDTYFRQMGGRELLSREGEIALAKRIEAAQLALLKHLYGVPMLIGQIARWGEELRAGSRSLRDLIDLSQSDAEPATAAANGGEAEAADKDDHRDESEARDAALIARVRRLAAPANEIAKLAKARVDAAARGRNISKERRARLDALLTKFAAAMTGVRLHPDRLVDLIAMVDQEQRALRQIERDLSRRTTASAELQEALVALTRRVGLPVDLFRQSASAIARARGEVRRGQEEMVSAHLRLVVAIAKK